MGRRVLLLAVCVGSAAAPPPDQLIRGAWVIDGAGGAPQVRDVLLSGDRIAAVGSRLTAPGARVIEGSGHTLLPGLIDVHTHLRYSTAGPLSGDWGKNLKAYLYCGVTSIADFGTYGETFEPVRRLIRSGVFEGPRVHFAARITTPGGHGAEGGRGDLFSLEVTTPTEAKAAVQRLVRYGPDAIKVFTDGWRYGFERNMTGMEEETLTALVEEAHRHSLPVLTHTVTVEKAREAARAGVDVVAHGLGDAAADPDLGALMKEAGAFYAPTLAVYESKTRNPVPDLVRAVLEPGAVAAVEAPRPAVRPSAARTGRWKHLMENTAALRAAGVAFAAGTDAGMTGTHHGYSTLHELELLVEGGLDPLEALTAATGNSARALRASDRGIVAPGKLADLVLVEGEPHKRIRDIYNVRRVFLGGREVDREKLRREIATEGVTPIPAKPVAPLLDDFESGANRSSIGTLWVNSTDSGHDHSRMSFVRTLRAPGDHALTVLATMSVKERPFARVHLPLSPGAVEPVDASGFQGIVFECRGDGEYRLAVASRTQRLGAAPSAAFTASAQWREVKIAWSDLRPAPGAASRWTAAELTDLAFEIARKPGESGWLELDRVRLFR